jgi:hypothetical protein
MKTFLTTIAMLCMATMIIAQSGNPKLGIRSHTLHPSDAKERGLEQAYGSLIRSVYPNSGAAEAGLQPFDYVIAVNGQPLSDDTDVHDVLENLSPGQLVQVDYIRKGNRQSTNLILSDSDALEQVHRSSEDDPFLGIGSSHNNMPNDLDYGVPVNVIHNSTAESIGMEDGDIILTVDGHKMYNWTDLSAAIDNRGVGDPIEVTYWQEGQAITRSRPIKSRAATHNDHSRPDGPVVIQAENPQAPVSEALIAPLTPDDVRVRTEEPEIPQEELISASAPATELRFEELTVFPNPSDGLFNIRFNLPERGNTIVRVFDSRGAEVYRNSLGKFSGTFSDRIDIANNVKGIYFLTIQQEERRISRKLVLQ